ncbi:YicC/YloC family endoribonuclease [Cytobacillus sp. FJAT-54145]|uniref:YicC/YloC family endoribonuclease n=1 Tax=Cytobacillus spartinae TaxID=3299023 RepID=A0ABW6K8G4_9BACI
MVLSMTGFGRSKRELNQFSVNVEVKTVNHRFSEYNIRMPRELLNIEDKLKKELAQYISRGRAEVFVTLEGEAVANRKVTIDWDLLDEYHQYIVEIQKKYNIAQDITIRDLLNREDFVIIEEEEAGNEEVEVLVLEAVKEAALQLKKMRVSEGEALKQDILGHLNQLDLKVHQITEYAPNVVRYYAERLKKRMQEFSEGQIDEYRIVNEVAIFADKADINEELTRLHSHIEQFTKTLDLDEPIGRKLDFLLQEMNREVNTIGSKANDSSIATEVVEMKSLLEKMKEQVQNIE